jgi:hypothetical protein
MAVLALILIVALFSTMAAVFAAQAHAERERLRAIVRAALEAEGVYDSDPVETEPVRQAA